jgi:hypothetical protein
MSNRTFETLSGDVLYIHDSDTGGVTRVSNQSQVILEWARIGDLERSGHLIETTAREEEVVDSENGVTDPEEYLLRVPYKHRKVIAPLPWKAYGCRVYDDNGNSVCEVSMAGSSTAQDGKIAEMIAAAINDAHSE